MGSINCGRHSITLKSTDEYTERIDTQHYLPLPVLWGCRRTSVERSSNLFESLAMLALRLLCPFLLFVRREFFKHLLVDCTAKSCLLSSRNIPISHALLEYWVDKAAVLGPPEIVCGAQAWPRSSVAREFSSQDCHGIGRAHFELPSLGLRLRVLIMKSPFYLLGGEGCQVLNLIIKNGAYVLPSAS